MRHYFEIVTDTGVPASVVKGDTGIFFGKISQVRVVPSVADTGGDLDIGVYPTSDTGDGFLIYSRTDCLGSAFTFVPRQPTHDLGGAVDAQDTGTPVSPAPIVGHGDALHVKVRAGQVAAAGGVNTTKVWIWTCD